MLKPTFNRLRITTGCLVRGKPFAAGAVLEVDDETASDLLMCGKAEPADDTTARRCRLGIEWVDPERAAGLPLVRVVGSA